MYLKQYFPVFHFFLQSGLKALCVLRLNPSTNIHSQVSLLSLMGLLGGYMGGIRYILELQALQGKTPESSQPEGDDTNQSVSSIEDDFFTALEHLEEDENGEGPCEWILLLTTSQV